MMKGENDVDKNGKNLKFHYKLCKIFLLRTCGHPLSRCFHIRSVPREGTAPCGPPLPLPAG